MANQDKTRALLKELDSIEKKAQVMRNETERLRKLKDEAKLALSSRYPDLFANVSKTSYDFSSKYHFTIAYACYFLYTFKTALASNWPSYLSKTGFTSSAKNSSTCWGALPTHLLGSTSPSISGTMGVK